jgi:tetratricopeptide (TPR) repeat protein
MISKFIRIALLVFIVAIASLAFVWNPEPVTVKLGATQQVTAPLALTLIVTFLSGAFLAMLIAGYFGLKSYFRERGYKDRERKRHQLMQLTLEARASMVMQDWDKALSEWQRVIDRDPADLAARIEVSHILERRGDLREALRSLDAVRAIYPGNAEILFRAAEINRRLGNRTAALDNVILILNDNPTRIAAQHAFELAEDLNRFEEALEYQQLRTRLGENTPELREATGRIECKIVEREHRSNPEALHRELQRFLKNYPDNLYALEKLAELSENSGNIEQAAKYLVRAARTGDKPDLLHRAAKLWLTRNQPERAIAALRTAIVESQPNSLHAIASRIELARLLVALNMFVEAGTAVTDLETQLKSYSGAQLQELSRQATALKGRLFSLQGKQADANRLWRVLTESDFDELQGTKMVHSNGGENLPPEPRLSTP